MRSIRWKDQPLCDRRPRGHHGPGRVEKGGLLHAPDCYMEKIVVGPSCKNAVELDAPVADNLKNIARRLQREVDDLVVIVLDRPRHEKLIADIRKAGARIRADRRWRPVRGHCSGGDRNRRACGHGFRRRTGRSDHAAAIRCLNGYMLGRLVINKPELEERIAKMGIHDKKNLRSPRSRSRQPDDLRRYRVTEGALMKGVRFFGEGPVHPR